ncbi:hypothetical protein U1Q18_003768 [Sarracenia purpurea var. burkii]
MKAQGLVQEQTTNLIDCSQAAVGICKPQRTETKRWKAAVQGRVLSPAENQRFGIKGFSGATETKRRKAAADGGEDDAELFGDERCLRGSSGQRKAAALRTGAP